LSSFFLYKTEFKISGFVLNQVGFHHLTFDQFFYAGGEVHSECTSKEPSACYHLNNGLAVVRRGDPFSNAPNPQTRSHEPLGKESSFSCCQITNLCPVFQEQKPRTTSDPADAGKT
jgi:hypothetical protein